MASASVEELLEKLRDDLVGSTAFTETEWVPEDVQEILKAFCHHRRILRILLEFCKED